MPSERIALLAAATGLTGGQLLTLLLAEVRYQRVHALVRKVDFDYVIRFAGLARKAGARRFLVVSSLGANPRSAVFYRRVKGEMEKALQGIGFVQLHVFEPSLLLGNRRQSRLVNDINAVDRPGSFRPPHANASAASGYSATTAIMSISIRKPLRNLPTGTMARAGL